MHRLFHIPLRSLRSTKEVLSRGAESFIKGASGINIGMSLTERKSNQLFGSYSRSLTTELINFNDHLAKVFLIPLVLEGLLQLLQREDLLINCGLDFVDIDGSILWQNKVSDQETIGMSLIYVILMFFDSPSPHAVPCFQQ